MIAVVDYSVGNLFSLTSSLKSIGADVCVTGDKEVIMKADKIILPGVGAFSDAAAKLRENGLDKIIIERANEGVPLMGICLGMQMLFEKSYEYGEHDGLGLIKGKVVTMEGVIDPSLKVPHIGWNALHFTENETDLFKFINEMTAYILSIPTMLQIATRLLLQRLNTIKSLPPQYRRVIYTAVSSTLRKVVKWDLKY